MDLSGIFRKNVIYHNLKSHKNQGLSFSLENVFLKKPEGGGGRGVQIDLTAF